jgi:hypothetical protein
MKCKRFEECGREAYIGELCLAHEKEARGLLGSKPKKAPAKKAAPRKRAAAKRAASSRTTTEASTTSSQPATETRA